MPDSLNYGTTASQRQTRYGRSTNGPLPTVKSAARPPKQTISSGNSDRTTSGPKPRPSAGRRRLVKSRPPPAEAKNSGGVFYDNKAAQTCYNFIKDRLRCEDTHRSPSAFGNAPAPLPEFISYILHAHTDSQFAIETLMVLVYRYSRLVHVKPIIQQEPEAISGNLIFLCALITAAEIHMGASDSNEFKKFFRRLAKLVDCKKRLLADIHQRFKSNIGHLGSASILERAYLIYFKMFRNKWYHLSYSKSFNARTHNPSLPISSIHSLTITFPSSTSYALQNKE